MIFFIDNTGTVVQSFVTPVYQTNTEGNGYIVCPFADNLSGIITFNLANGVMTTPRALTYHRAVEVIDNAGNKSLLHGWAFDLTDDITAYYGTVTAQVTFFMPSGKRRASSSFSFVVGRGARSVLPLSPSQTIYEDILSAVSGLSTDLKNGFFPSSGFFQWREVEDLNGERVGYSAGEYVIYRADEERKTVWLKSKVSDNTDNPYIDGILSDKWEFVGEIGDMPSVEVGETVTIPSGSSARVESENILAGIRLTFYIPEGEKGEKGDKGEDGYSIFLLDADTTEETLYVKTSDIITRGRDLQVLDLLLSNNGDLFTLYRYVDGAEYQEVVYVGSFLTMSGAEQAFARKVVEDYIPEGTSAINQLVNRSTMDEEIRTNASHDRGTFSTWSSVPMSEEWYDEDNFGSRIPTTRDTITVLDSSDYHNHEIFTTKDIEAGVAYSSGGIKTFDNRFNSTSMICLPVKRTNVSIGNVYYAIMTLGGTPVTAQRFVNNDSSPEWWTGSTEIRNYDEGDFMLVMTWENKNDASYYSDAVIELITNDEKFFDTNFLESNQFGSLEGVVHESTVRLVNGVEGEIPPNGTYGAFSGKYTCAVIREGSNLYIHQTLVHPIESGEIVYTVIDTYSNFPTTWGRYCITGNPYFCENIVRQEGVFEHIAITDIDDKYIEMTAKATQAGLYYRVHAYDFGGNWIGEVCNVISSTSVPSGDVVKAYGELPDGTVYVRMSFPNTTVNVSMLSARLAGTWTFKYLGLWSENNKDGWIPKEQKSQVSFTLEQMKAINSGITEEKLNNIENTFVTYSEMISRKADWAPAGGTGWTSYGGTVYLTDYMGVHRVRKATDQDPNENPSFFPTGQHPIVMRDGNEQIKVPYGPIEYSDATSKGYVDGLISGINLKIDFSGPYIVDQTTLNFAESLPNLIFTGVLSVEFSLPTNDPYPVGRDFHFYITFADSGTAQYPQPNVVFPSSFKFINGEIPTFEWGKTYEISMQNYCVVVACFEGVE